MRGLFNDFGGTNLSYTLEDVQNRMSSFSAGDQTEFFNTYIVGSRKIPLKKYLNKAGLQAEIEDDQLRVSRQEEETTEQREVIHGLLGVN
jgi:predicted metalloprotease with PDZ domain